MDILEIYGKLKEAGGIKIERYTGGAFTATVQSFDPMTGKPLAPQIGTFNMKAISEERERIAARLAAIDDLIAELNVTPEK